MVLEQSEEQNAALPVHIASDHQGKSPLHGWECQDTKIIKYTDPEWNGHLVSGCCKQLSDRKQNTAATTVSRFVSQGLALVSIGMDL